MAFIFEILKETPWWIYGLFCYLVTLGLKATKRRTIPLKQLFLLPSIFTLWSLYSLATKFQTNIYLSTIWALSILAGYYLGWGLTRPQKLQADKKRRLIVLPGSWAPLISFLLIFSGKYFFGFTYATNPDASHSLAYLGPDIGLSGILTGIFLGKLLCIWHKYKFCEHTDLLKN